MKNRFGFWLGLAVVAVGAFSDAGSARAQTIYYVDADAPGVNNGSSWCDAFVDLQTAFAAGNNSLTSYEIRVAEGTYKPTSGTDRRKFFLLKRGVAIYGGFAGCGEADPDARDFTLYETILSGDLAGDDTDPTVGSDCCRANGTQTCDNDACRAAVCHQDERPSCCTTEWDALCGVAARVLCPGVCGNRDENTKQIVRGDLSDPTAILDGFTITGGNADGNNPTDRGGGFANGFLGTSSPTIRNCIFRDNVAKEKGGAVANGESFGEFVNCLFVNNVSKDAGAIYNIQTAATFLNCTITENSAYRFQGGIRNNTNDSPFVINSILWGNIDAGGSDESAQINVGSGTTLTLAYSCVQGLTESLVYLGGGNVSVDPLFVDPVGADGRLGTSDDDFRLSVESPLIDAGDPEAEASPCDSDLDLEARIEDGRIDMGAYEDGAAAPDQQSTHDLRDFAWFQQCFQGTPLISCLCANDADGNELIDLGDLPAFMAVFTGP